VVWTNQCPFEELLAAIQYTGVVVMIDRRFIQSPGKYFLQTVSKVHFPDGSVQQTRLAECCRTLYVTIYFSKYLYRFFPLSLYSSSVPSILHFQFLFSASSLLPLPPLFFLSPHLSLLIFHSRHPLSPPPPPPPPPTLSLSR